MMRAALPMIVLMFATGCGRSITTDGSPDAARVARWLSSSDRLSDNEAMIVPRASLVMSDYSIPLNHANLHKLGPDRIAGCTLSSVRRSGREVVALWGCAQTVPEIRRQVWFGLEGGKIGYARYSEADMGMISAVSRSSPRRDQTEVITPRYTGSSNARPAPRATQISASSATITGSPVALASTMSIPRSSDPPPVITIPWS